ncbi:MAG: TraB/GumN family protein [Treponema sp.]|nr:TraB/GumN family protein [Treponema sp.]
MKNLKKILSALSAVLLLSLSLSVLSCASSPSSDGSSSVSVRKQKAVLTKNPERMFWTITGTDSNGKPSHVHILGTIHAADERVFPLGDKVIESFTTADRLVAEISLDDIQMNLMSSVMEAMTQDVLPDGKDILSDLSESQRSMLGSILGDQLGPLSRFKPWVSTTSCQNAYLGGIGFDARYGVDMSIYGYAIENGKKVEGLDALSTQLGILRYGDYETQLQILKDLLDDLANPTEVHSMMMSLYEAYLKDDVAAVGKICLDNMKADEKRSAIYKDYDRMLYNDRNKAWAEKITEYLDKGGETFIFAGCAHFTAGETVFHYLKKLGTL